MCELEQIECECEKCARGSVKCGTILAVKKQNETSGKQVEIKKKQTIPNELVGQQIKQITAHFDYSYRNRERNPKLSAAIRALKDDL